MDFLCLCGCGGLACSDGPYRLVCDDYTLELLGGEVEQDVLYLGLADVKVLASLPLVKVLTYAEDYAETSL